MFHLYWISLTLTILLLSGCTTTTVAKEPQNTEIKITTSGTLVFKDLPITQEQLPDLLRKGRVKRDDTLHILVPMNKEQRDYRLMRSVTDTLKRAGYGRIVFTTEKKALGVLKEDLIRKP